MQGRGRKPVKVDTSEIATSGPEMSPRNIVWTLAEMRGIWYCPTPAETDLRVRSGPCVLYGCSQRSWCTFTTENQHGLPVDNNLWGLERIIIVRFLLFYIIRVWRERGGSRIRQGTEENTEQSSSLKLFFFNISSVTETFSYLCGASQLKGCTWT